MQLFDLTGRNAIVTGAAGGLGRAMAEGLHEAGAEIVIIDVAAAGAKTAAKIGKTGPPTHFLQADLSDRNQVELSFSAALEKLNGTLDIIVNNVGMHKRKQALGFPSEDWDEVIGLNLNTQFMFCQLAGRHMIEKGYGKIINIASIIGITGGLNAAAYSASKSGVIAMSKSLSNEWSDKGVYVNVIAPGYIGGTALNDDMEDARKESITLRIPKGHWGCPDDLKGAVIFLASSASDYVCGSVLVVDGGFLSR